MRAAACEAEAVALLQRPGLRVHRQRHLAFKHEAGLFAVMGVELVAGVAAGLQMHQEQIEPALWIKGPSDISYLIRYAERLWPQLKGVNWTHGWNSRLAITADHYPHVHAPAENLLISLGCNGRGVALSTAMGAQLARRLIGGPGVEIDMPVTGIKPIPMHAFWRVGVTTAVLAGRVRDRLGV